MASLNKVMLIGNLTRDPEVRYTPKGSAVADLAIAINRVYSADNGEKREEVTYVEITLWASLAELAGKYLHKGRSVFVEGRLQLDSWDDKATGQKRSKLRVIGENIQFLDRREGGPTGGDEQGGHGGSAPAPAPRQAARPAGAAQRPAPGRQGPPSEEFGEGPITDGLDDDDIPF